MQITNGAIEDILDEEELAGAESPKGIYKAYKEILYNQLDIDPYSCTLVASFTALSNFTGQIVPLEVMKRAFEELKSTTFVPGVGDKLSNGVRMALKHFNAHFGTSIKEHMIPLRESTIIMALSKGSPVVTGIKYGKGYFIDEQDDGQIQSGNVGSGGHAISIVKLNNEDDTLIKYAENYNGKKRYNIILLDLNAHKGLMFNTGFYFTK